MEKQSRYTQLDEDPVLAEAFHSAFASLVQVISTVSAKLAVDIRVLIPTTTPIPPPFCDDET